MNRTGSLSKYRKLSAAVLAGLLWVSLSQGQDTPEKQAEKQAEALFNAAKKAFNDRQYPNAVNAFRDYLTKFGKMKDVPAARYGLALSLLELPQKDYAGAIKELQQLAALRNEEAKLLGELRKKKRETQLHHFLERYRIDRADIPRIGAGRRLQLASFGIETAADITRPRVIAIPGFGEVIAKSLLKWRASVEARFVFNAAAPIDPAEIAKVKAQVAAQKAAKVGEVKAQARANEQAQASAPGRGRRKANEAFMRNRS